MKPNQAAEKVEVFLRHDGKALCPLVRLYVPGDEMKSGEDDFGYCQLVRTLHLTKAAQ